MMQSPLESIRGERGSCKPFSDLSWSDRHYLWRGACLVFLKKITKPIMELADLSKEMANLNFDARYTRGGSDEIGILWRKLQ